MPIIWERADGSIAVTQLTEEFLARERKEGEITSDAVLRLARDHVQAKAPDLAGLTPVLVKSADIPTDRRKRYAWRLSTIDGTSKVIVDVRIPEVVSPADQARAELLALDPKAVTLEDLPGIVERLQKVI